MPRLVGPPETAAAVDPAPWGTGGRLEALYAIAAPGDIVKGLRGAPPSIDCRGPGRPNRLGLATCLWQAQVRFSQGTRSKPPEISTPDRHLSGDRCPRTNPGSKSCRLISKPLCISKTERRGRDTRTNASGSSPSPGSIGTWRRTRVGTYPRARKASCRLKPIAPDCLGRWLEGEACCWLY
jgi:hypothetical protein